MLQYELNYDHLMLFIHGYWHYDFTKFLSFEELLNFYFWLNKFPFL